MDKIIINGIKVFGYHGVFPEEKVLGQKFVFDVELYTETKETGLSDDYTKAINYVEIVNIVERAAKEKKYNLLEALAENAAHEILKIEGVKNVKLAVKKPAPPVDAHFDFVAVEIFR
jgi:dihydroneopterin aldolase